MSDWSSDVCSSDLDQALDFGRLALARLGARLGAGLYTAHRAACGQPCRSLLQGLGQSPTSIAVAIIKKGGQEAHPPVARRYPFWQIPPLCKAATVRSRSHARQAFSPLRKQERKNCVDAK